MKKILLCSLAASTYLLAAAPDLAKDDELKTHTELGYVETQGNTDTKTFALDFAGTKGFGRHIFKLDIDAQFAEDSGTQSKNKFFTEFNYDYEFTDTLAFNYLIGYKQDRFSGYNSQFYTGPGIAYKVLNSDTNILNTSANVLYSQDALEATSTEGSYIKRYGAYVLKGDYTWNITEGFKFVQDLSFRSEFRKSQNFFVFSKTAFESKINSIFSLGISYKVDYKNLPPQGKKSTDTTLAAAIIIDY